MEKTITMNENEIFRLLVVQKLNDKLITQTKAAKLLNISDRQVRNLIRSFEKEGPKGLISKKRGKRSNRAFSSEFEKEVISIVGSKYEDFGPTLSQEKLAEKHNITISVETLRKLMIRHHLHIPKAKKKKVYQERLRREHFGELIQIDASIHDWFEGRADKCALIVLIDDATSKITSLHFHPSECLESYLIALEPHLKKYGRPLGIYSDRHAIFGGSDRIKHAQLIRAFKELNIESILANSPQAKGRVERVNRTLQDRLVKEMRLRGISNIEDANRFMKEYLAIHNEKFSKEPRGQIDTHRPLDSGHNLEYILTHREERTVSNSLSISFYNKKIIILEPNMSNRLKRKKVNVIQSKEGEVKVYYQGKQLHCAPAEEVISEKRILDYKEKNFWRPKAEVPKNNHPWKKYGYQVALSNKIKRMERDMI